ncbi:MAG: hypothetical protein HPY52_12410 [Firmicutes bacterium]|nr:hypothetical protein [Bacillota bacterium]
MPSHNLGIFVIYNSPDGVVARDQLVRAFLDRYFASYADWPGKSAGEESGAALEPDAGASSEAGAAAEVGAAMEAGSNLGPVARVDGAQPREGLDEYADVYGSTRVPRTTVDRLIELISVATVRLDPAVFAIWLNHWNLLGFRF